MAEASLRPTAGDKLRLTRMEAGVFRDELTDVDLIAQTLWSGVHGVISLHIAKTNDEWVDWVPLELRSRVMVEAVLRGMLKECK